MGGWLHFAAAVRYLIEAAHLTQTLPYWRFAESAETMEQNAFTKRT
jgi:hypothetical protein